jgi:hypothetical protein
MIPGIMGRVDDRLILAAVIAIPLVMGLAVLSVLIREIAHSRPLEQERRPAAPGGGEEAPGEPFRFPGDRDGIS